MSRCPNILLVVTDEQRSMPRSETTRVRGWQSSHNCSAGPPGEATPRP